MAVRSIKVWNASASAWEGVGVEAPDFGAFVSASLVTAKGDLLAGTGSGSVDNLAAGANGQMLVADSAATLGLRYMDPPTTNMIPNGNFAIWQRGTTFSAISNTAYSSDRWWAVTDAVGTVNVTRQDIPASNGFGGYVLRAERSAGTNRWVIGTNLETRDVAFLTGKTITLSYYLRKGSALTSDIDVTLKTQNAEPKFSTALEGTSATISNSSLNTSTFVRFSQSLSVGTANPVAGLGVEFSANQAGAADAFFEIMAVQLEVGPVATPFEFEPFEATLRKCQRYYYKHAEGTDGPIGMGAMYSSTALLCVIQLPTTMRTAPSLSATSGTNYYQFTRNSTADDFDAMAVDFASTTAVAFQVTSGVSGTAGHGGWVRTQNASASLALSAEL